MDPIDPAIRDPIRKYIVEKLLGGDSRGLDDDTELLTMGILRSMTTLELTGHIEKTFGIRIGSAKINPTTFKSLRTLTKLVADTRAATKPTGG